jgi:hypothetical protein
MIIQHILVIHGGPMVLAAHLGMLHGTAKQANSDVTQVRSMQHFRRLAFLADILCPLAKRRP